MESRGQLQAAVILSEFCHSSHIWQTARGHFITRLKKLLACHYKYNPGSPRLLLTDTRRRNHRAESPSGSLGSRPRSHGKVIPRPGPGSADWSAPGIPASDWSPVSPVSSWDSETEAGSVCLKLPARAEGAGGRLRARAMSGIRWVSGYTETETGHRLEYQTMFPHYRHGERRIGRRRRRHVAPLGLRWDGGHMYVHSYQ